MALQVPVFGDGQVQSTIKKVVFNGLKPEKIIMKLERLGLPIPSRKSLYNRIAYLWRIVIKNSSEFNTKDLRDWAETLSFTLEEDAPLVIGQNVKNNVDEDGVMIRWLGHLGRCVWTSDHATHCFVCFVCYGCVLGHLYSTLQLHLHWHHYIVVVTCVIVPFRLLYVRGVPGTGFRTALVI